MENRLLAGYQIIKSAVLFLIGLILAVTTVNICVDHHNGQPVLLQQPAEITTEICSAMDAFCTGDYDLASHSLLGTPDLGVHREATDPVGVMLWDAFLESMSYELVGDCYATSAGIAQDVTVICLDISSATAGLEDRAKVLMAQQVDEAEDMSEIYDEDNEYREDFVMSVLYDATRAALKEDARLTTTTITINLTYQDGQWWIIPEKGLLEVVSGGVLS